MRPSASPRRGFLSSFEPPRRYCVVSEMMPFSGFCVKVFCDTLWIRQNMRDVPIHKANSRRRKTVESIFLMLGNLFLFRGIFVRGIIGGFCGGREKEYEKLPLELFWWDWFCKIALFCGRGGSRLGAGFLRRLSIMLSMRIWSKSFQFLWVL